MIAEYQRIIIYITIGGILGIALAAFAAVR